MSQRLTGSRGRPGGLPLHGRRRARRPRRERGRHARGRAHRRRRLAAAARPAGRLRRHRRRVDGDVGQPVRRSGDSRLLVHRTSASAYGLALRHATTALPFRRRGRASRVAARACPHWRSPAQITLEAWVRPTATDGLRDIVALRPRHARPAEVYLRIVQRRLPDRSSYTNTGSEATGHLLAMPAERPEHLGAPGRRLRRHRLAPVPQRRAWWRRRPTRPARSRCPRCWTIGGSHNGDRPFAGDIDEVRLWSTGRSAADIAASMNTPLAGTEPSLAGRLALRRQGHARRHAGAPRRRGPPGCVDRQPRPASGVLGHRDGRQPAARRRCRGSRPVRGPMWQRRSSSSTGSSVAAGGYLDAGDSTSLDLSRDLTIEAGVRVDDLSRAARHPHPRGARRRHRRRRALRAVGCPGRQPGVRLRGQEPRPCTSSRPIRACCTPARSGASR